MDAQTKITAFVGDIVFLIRIVLLSLSLSLADVSWLLSVG